MCDAHRECKAFHHEPVDPPVVNIRTIDYFLVSHFSSLMERGAQQTTTHPLTPSQEGETIFSYNGSKHHATMAIDRNPVSVDNSV
jgi:hypothetical protein